MCVAIITRRSSQGALRETKIRRKTKISVNVPQLRNNRCANFQFERLKVRDGVALLYSGLPHNMSALDRHI